MSRRERWSSTPSPRIATSFLILPVSELAGSTASRPFSGAMFLIGSIQLLRAPTASRSAMRLFGFSITYVTLLFGAVMVDVLVRHGW
ncbi:MAG: hypothetical protein R2705_23250 [Ilumatobacteraceae bacterium]